MGWHEWTDRLYWKVQPFLAPGLRNSQHDYAQILKASLPSATRWLDLGCGHDFLPRWMSAAERRLDLQGCQAVGLDADSASLSRHQDLTHRVTGDVELLPFRDGVFDLVTANMVLEHVRRPALLFREVSRTLAVGGRFVVHTPNVRGYTTLMTIIIPEGARAGLAKLLLQRELRDVYPTHYRANTSEAFRDLAQAAGLAVDEVRHLESSPQSIAVPPVLVLELAVARIVRTQRFAPYRPCLLGVFRKAETSLVRPADQS